MRGSRIKEPGEAYYHMISRVVDRRMVFDAREKERLRKTLRWLSRHLVGCVFMVVPPCGFRIFRRFAGSGC